MKIKFGLIGAIAISALTLSACATSDLKAVVGQGDAVSTSKKSLQPTNAQNIAVYSETNRLKHYRVIGRVSAQNYNFLGVPASQATILIELKKQAASLGATGITHISTGLAQTTADAVVLKKK